MQGKLKSVEGRVIVSVEMSYKDQVAFADGTVLQLGRKFNNLDQKYTQPVNAKVISSAYIPEGAEILIHHNCTHDTYRIFNYQQTGGDEASSDIKYFSIPEDKCYLYSMDGEEWLPLKNFVTALRVFRPYFGILQGIEPTWIKDTLYITSGELAGNICHTLRSCDYQIVFQGTDLRERNIIRCRHSENSDFEREEITAISHSLTQELRDGKLWLGLTASDCKPLSEIKVSDAAKRKFLGSETYKWFNETFVDEPEKIII
jgi:hypothetical protein